MEEKSQNYFHLEILHLVHTKRSLHGIRQEDFERYFTYCKERLKRIRHKFKTHRKAKTYQKSNLTPEMVTDIKILTIPLFCTERSWSYYSKIQHLKNVTLKHKRFMVKKLKKATKYSNQLLELVTKTPCDFSTILESNAYFSYINLLYSIAKNDFVSGLNFVLRAKKFYELLLSYIVSDIRGIYLEKIEELNELEKFCIYNLKDSINTDDRNKIIERIQNDIEKIKPISNKMQIVFDWYPNVFYAIDGDFNDLFMEYQKIEGNLILFSDKINIENYESNLSNGTDSHLSVSNQQNSSFDVSRSNNQEFKEILFKMMNKIDYLISKTKTILSEKNVPYQDISMRDVQETQRALLIMKHTINIYLYNRKLNKINIKKLLKNNLKMFDLTRIVRLINRLISNNEAIVKIYLELDKQTSLHDEYIKVLESFRCYFGALIFKRKGSIESSIHLLYKSLFIFNQISCEFLEKYKNDFNINLLNLIVKNARLMKIDMDLEILGEPKPRMKKSCVVNNLHAKDFDWNDSNLISIPCPMMQISCPPLIEDKVLDMIKWPEIEGVRKEHVEEEFHDPVLEPEQTLTDRLKNWLWG